MVVAVVAVVAVDCVDVVDDSEYVRRCVGVFSSSSSKEQVEKTGESPSVVEGNEVVENMESTDERALDVDDMEEDLLAVVKLLFSMGISAYVIYSSAL